MLRVSWQRTLKFGAHILRSSSPDPESRTTSGLSTAKTMSTSRSPARTSSRAPWLSGRPNFAGVRCGRGRVSIAARAVSSTCRSAPSSAARTEAARRCRTGKMDLPRMRSRRFFSRSRCTAACLLESIVSERRKHETGERWAEPEILRIHGESLARRKGRTAKLAIDRLENAIELAYEQGSRSLQLRATMSLARIQARTGKPARTIDRLLKIYETFSEGFGTIDLIEAKRMLTAATAT